MFLRIKLKIAIFQSPEKNLPELYQLRRFDSKVSFPLNLLTLSEEHITLASSEFSVTVCYNKVLKTKPQHWKHN